MPGSDEAQLDEYFEDLRQRIKTPAALSPTQGDPIFYFVYPPQQTLTVRRLWPGWKARLIHQDGLTVEELSLADVLWAVVDEAPAQWAELLEWEASFSTEDLNGAIRDLLVNDNALVRRVAERVTAARPGVVLFLTDVELLHPYFRTRFIESYLNNKVAVPTVLFYPGLRVGEYGLRFLGFYPEDSGYRSPVIGGLT
jgi:hypothetical protein